MAGLGNEGIALGAKRSSVPAFVHSVLLYSCEVWNITETEMKALVGRNGYMMRGLVGEVVRSEVTQKEVSCLARTDG